MGKAAVKAQLDKRRILKDETYPVRLIIYFNGKKKRYSTTKRIFLPGKEWKKVNSPRLKQENLIFTKAYINKELARATKIIEDLELSGSEFSFELFDALFIENKKRITLFKHNWKDTIKIISISCLYSDFSYICNTMLEYACLVGIQQLYPNIPKAELKALYELFSSKTEVSTQKDKI